MDTFYQLIHDHVPNVLFYILLLLILVSITLKIMKEIFYDKDADQISYGKWIKSLFYKRKTDVNKDGEKKLNDIIVYSDEDRESLIKNLENDDFFQEIKKCKLGHISAIDFGSPDKNVVFTNIMKIYVETIEEAVLRILRENKLDKLTTTELNDLLSREIDIYSKNIYEKIKVSLGDKLYKLLIESKKGFKIKNSDCREILIDSILTISNQSPDKYDYDNYDKAHYILTSMCAVLKVSMKNFERLFKDFNGDMEEIMKNS